MVKIKSKKGWSYLASILLSVAAILIVFVVVMSMNTPLSRSISTIACHGNCAARSMVPFKEWMTPLMFCNSHETPIKIDATKFSDCPSLDTSSINQFNKEEYYKQCARIQINELSENCWKMGGKGKYDLTPILSQIKWGLEKKALDDPLAFTPALAVIAPVRLLTNHDEFGDVDWFEVPKASGVLRCFRFQIVKPRGLSFDDHSLGYSNYAYNDILGTDEKTSGVIMDAIDPDEEGKTEINLKYTALLNYDYVAEDICYISMYADGGGAIARSCNKWSKELDRYAILN